MNAVAFCNIRIYQFILSLIPKFNIYSSSKLSVTACYNDLFHTVLLFSMKTDGF